MKRTLALFLTMCLALTLFAGCGSAQTNSNETPDDRSVTVTDMSGDSVTIEMCIRDRNHHRQRFHQLQRHRLRPQ